MQFPHLFVSLLCSLLPVENAASEPPVEPGTAVAGALPFEDLALPVQDEKPEEFSGSINAGVSASSGNTDITKINVNANATWDIDDKNRLNGLFDWLYAEEKNQTTKVSTISQRRTRAALQYDRILSKKLYAFARADATGDGVQNLDLRLILSAGLGYQLLDTKEEKLSGELGLAYTHEDFKAMSPDEYVALRIAGKYFKKITDDLVFDATLEWLPSLEDQDDQVVLGMAKLGYKLGAGLVTSLRYEFDYDNTPPPGNDRIDHRVIWGLGYTF